MISPAQSKTRRLLSLTPIPILVAVIAVLVATGARPGSSIGDDATTSPIDRASGSTATATTPVVDAASTPDPVAAELDRLIDLFADRAAERGQSIEYRQLGTLLLDRAELNSDLADYRAALDGFTTALELDPEHVAGLIGQGRAALGVHDFTTALGAADTVARIDPDNPDGLALVVDVAFATGDRDRAGTAIAALVEATAPNPESSVGGQLGPDPAVLVRQAQLAAVDPDTGPQQARALAAQAIVEAERRGLDSGDIAFYQALAGRMAYDQGDLATAAEFLEQAVANAPDDHGALGELARVRAATGDLDEAIELLERSDALVPEPDHLVLLGDIRVLAGQEAEAEADYEAAVTLATSDDDHRTAWARALAFYHLDHGGDLDLAAELAADERSVRRDIGAHDLAAWSAYRSGDLDTARTEIDAAMANGRPGAIVWYHAAVISAAQGETGQARQELEAALATNSGFDPLSVSRAEQLADDLGLDRS